MSKRQHSSTASESNAADAADTSLIDVHVFETPDANKLNKQNKKNSKKSKTENEKQNQKSMTDFIQSGASKTTTEHTETPLEKRLDEISAKLSHMLTKNDTSFIKTIIKDTLEEIKEKFLGSVLKKLEVMEGSVFESKNEIDALKRTIKEQRSEIDALKKAQQDAESIHNSSQNDLEQYGRRNSVRISGLANDSDQQTSMVVADETISLLSKKLGLKLESKDVDVAHRLGKYAPNKNRPVIVKFVRRQTKIDIMQRAKLLKGTGVFINEDLTKINAEVLSSLRLKEPALVERAWSREGKLFVRYRGQDRNEFVSFDKYKLWLAKPWPNKNNGDTRTTYARKVSDSNNSRLSNKT